jgi:hypothetical protein
MSLVKAVMQPVGVFLGTLIALLVLLKALAAVMPRIVESLGITGGLALTLVVFGAVISWIAGVAGLDK